MSRIVPSVSRIASYVQNIKFNEVVFDNVHEKFKKNKPNKAVKLKPNEFSSIEFKNISFKYHESPINVLDNFNFKISKGEKILILGESGSGKSTFIDVLIGLQKINSGEIFYNSKLVNDYNNLQLNKIISYLPQEPYLFNSTISTNITLADGSENIDEKKLNESLIISRISNYVDKLIDGKNTVIGEDGSKLSGGQKKRIGIARAIYSIRDIIVLDEPTSYLDEKTEMEIIKNILKQNNLTVVMVSHKEKFQELFDKTVNFNNS